MAKLLVFSGSSRRESVHTRLAVLLASVAEQEGAQTTLIRLEDFDIPIYNGDLEEEHGLPGDIKRLKALLSENTGLIITCPEYNGFMTPLLINTINWCTRSEEATPDLSGFADKAVLVASGSPSSLGGIRANTHLKTMLSGIGAIVFPQSLTVPATHQAFDSHGGLAQASMGERIERTLQNFIAFTDRFHSA
ncbi:MAG: FMN reductase [Gammaproteobacteria bacterium]|nr:FMN reductase [Gammaproteobacteria bacterium]|tara:strand:- start:4792 stop:5367 length:576 start_codon:yes stop_codon:yes gene_type:complete